MCPLRPPTRAIAPDGAPVSRVLFCTVCRPCVLSRSPGRYIPHLEGRVCRLCFSGLDTIGVGLVGPGLFGAELITGAVVAGLFAGVVGAGLFAGVVGAGLFAGVVAGLLRGRGRRNYVDFTYRIFQHSRRRAYDEDIFSFM